VQPRPDSLTPVRALAWRITCDNELLVTIVVADHHVMLLSKDGRRPESAESKYRLGTYLDSNEAALKAIDMTGSYERLRHGKVGEYAELSLPADGWSQTLAEGNVGVEISKLIDAALSPVLSPAVD